MSDQQKGNVWGAVVAGIGLVAVLVTGLCIKDYMMAFLFSVILGVMLFTFTTQMFWGEAVPECLFFFIKTFRMPGLIFTLDLDGIIWLITVKLTLSILFAVLSVLIFVFGFFVTLIFSVVAYPFAMLSYFKK